MRLRETPTPQTALARAVCHEPYMGIMILAPTARHRAGRPAMSMGEVEPMERHLPAAV